MIDDPLNRLSVKRGSQLAWAKLDESIVKQILADVEYRKELDELRADYTNAALAAKYGVHVRTLEKAICGESWSHVVGAQ